MAQPIVIDANLCIALVIPVPYSETAACQWLRWQSNRDPICAPLLCEYEIVSALQKAVAVKLISKKEAEKAFERILALGVERIPPEPALH